MLPLGFDFSRFDAPAEERRRRRETFREELGIPLDALLVTIVARLEPIKRVDRFLRVANGVKTSPHSWFLVVGDGGLREQLQKSSEAVQLGDRLVWAGLRDDMPDVYFATDVLVVTSDNEGTNVSAIEAQAAGLPVVSTRVGGMASVVGDGTGLLVDQEDEEGFARALERVLLDDALERDLGRSGAERARSEFSLVRLVENIDSLYRQLVNEASEPSRTQMMVSGPSPSERSSGGEIETADTEPAIHAALKMLRCLECRGALELDRSDAIRCVECGRRYPIVAGSPVMLRKGSAQEADPDAELRRRTADSFAYEWNHFGELRPEWERNFREYLRPHKPEWLGTVLCWMSAQARAGTATKRTDWEQES